MTPRKTYPPVFVKPGETTNLTANDGEMAFIGIYDDTVIDFVTAFYELKKMSESMVPVTLKMHDHQQKKIFNLFNKLPTHLKNLVTEREAGGGIWIPDGGDDGA